jgi:hypothetical protein
MSGGVLCRAVGGAVEVAARWLAGVSVRSTFLECGLFFDGNPSSAQARVVNVVVDVRRCNYAQAVTQFPEESRGSEEGHLGRDSMSGGALLCRAPGVDRPRSLQAWAACGFNSGGSRLF